MHHVKVSAETKKVGLPDAAATEGGFRDVTVLHEDHCGDVPTHYSYHDLMTLPYSMGHLCATVASDHTVNLRRCNRSDLAMDACAVYNGTDTLKP